MGDQFRGSTTAIDSSNIGFQLLKKHGWKEGTGLGISEQGRLEPVLTYLKNNKRGLGADHNKKLLVKKNNTTESSSAPASSSSSKDKNNQDRSSSRKSKALSKKQRKMQELEKRLQDKEFERGFFREFWPDNV
ncbi:PREDICTED: PIN2/TERF1-interacting telomerase inhibitor 1-like [Populus euphratica]|uniref:PIN2/TERF1-interacting telomerase inhibitor 1-like n=1 Tax=Populus euphratica TaxID=75702 RepID=A0AAJ6UNC9_POPEU|nr:PREDICTED: PIN2/TERF1-interacting telomerase inhibitor 1-like [Populus euphratica]